jgi:hypothetical protein
MTGLKYVGYKEAVVQKREMTVGELRHRIAIVYLKHPGKRIVILSLDDGERLELSGIEDALAFGWDDGCKIELIGMPHDWGVVEGGIMEDDSKCIITVQMAPEEVDGNTVI